MKAARGTYPQIDPGAAALVNTRVVTLEGDRTAQAALALARRRDVMLLLARGSRVVRRDDLAHAVDLDLGDLPARAVACPVPVVSAGTSEIVVRRHLANGALAVLVRDGGRVTGAITPRMTSSLPPPSMRRQLARLPDDVRDVLERVGRLAAGVGARAWLVGGLVRDLVSGLPRERADVDVVVEGDAPAVARLLAAELSGTLTIHARFLTASVETCTVGTVDVITARSERYLVPGELPRVTPAGIDRDLRRRDFAVNAMAIALGSDDAGLLDPLGGRADVAARRLRILHPLSFVDDPTRILRGARYAARLGFALDVWTRQCRRLAVVLAPYPALSAGRLFAELEAIARDACPDVALRELGDAGAYRLLDAGYRFTERARAWIAELPATFAWCAAVGVGAPCGDLVVATLVADQHADVRGRSLARLSLAGDPRARLEGAISEAPRVRQALTAAATASGRARVLRALSPLALAWQWLTAPSEIRAILDAWATRGRGVAPDLRGDDVIALGVPRGPAVAAVLDALRDARLDGGVRDRNAEAEWVRRWVVTRKEG